MQPAASHFGYVAAGRRPRLARRGSARTRRASTPPRWLPRRTTCVATYAGDATHSAAQSLGAGDDGVAAGHYGGGESRVDPLWAAHPRAKRDTQRTCWRRMRGRLRRASRRARRVLSPVGVYPIAATLTRQRGGELYGERDARANLSIAQAPYADRAVGFDQHARAGATGDADRAGDEHDQRRAHGQA